jgi:hypothetical protein
MQARRVSCIGGAGYATMEAFQKKMVPSDFRSASLIAGMHGTEHCAKKRRTHSFPAPRHPFCEMPLRCAEARRLPLPSGTVRSRRSFARPQRFPLTRIPFRGQCSSPWRFAHLRTARSSPFGLWLHSPPLVCPSGWPYPRLSPLPSRRLVLQIGLPISTPLQELFAPSGSKRSTGCPAFRSAFQIRPIFVRSPQPLI